MGATTGTTSGTDKPSVGLWTGGTDPAFRKEVETALSPHFAVHMGRQPYGLGGGGDPTQVEPVFVFLTFLVTTFQGLPTELIGAAIYDMITKLKREKPRKTTVLVQVERDHERILASTWIESEDLQSIEKTLSAFLHTVETELKRLDVQTHR